jgi:hypothetical protein
MCTGNVMPSREYRDPSGTLWDVFEVHRINHRPNAVRPALSSGWLAFVSPAEKRRLPEYPADWVHRSDDELEELRLAAFLAPHPIYPVSRAGDASPPRAEGRRSPRGSTEPRRSVAESSEVGSSSVLTNATPRLGSAGVEALVRSHARQARKNGVAVIEGMLGVKRALSDAGEESSPEVLKQLRKLFVEEFFFGE